MIAIVHYQPMWPEQFASLGRSLRESLENPALRIDHIGSTSVPGLPAKNIIDIQRGTERRVNLHVRVAGRATQRYAVLFRDYLRANGAAASAYGQVKVTLAGYHGEDVDAYYAIKDPVCDILMAGAEAWAVTVGWMPGPSDQ